MLKTLDREQCDKDMFRLINKIESLESKTFVGRQTNEQRQKVKKEEETNTREQAQNSNFQINSFSCLCLSHGQFLC